MRVSEMDRWESSVEDIHVWEEEYESDSSQRYICSRSLGFST